MSPERVIGWVIAAILLIVLCFVLVRLVESL